MSRELVTKRELWVERLGVVPYAQALDFQRQVAKARISGALPEDVLLLVEHPPVVTLGRSAKEQNLLASPELLAARGVELFEVERGGDVTFHGPGQLVGYPIIDLKQHRQDLHWYLRQVEEALIVGLAQLGIEGERSDGLTGVWTAGRKIASIGVHARDWVTWHGFALNVATDLSYFSLMVPCGIQAVTMTSVHNELGCHPERSEGSLSADSDPSVAALPQDDKMRPSIDEVATLVAAAFGEVFDLRPIDAAGAVVATVTSPAVV